MTSALLALWNDYPDDHSQEYAFWHGFEHVPERLTVPGMQAARRYRSISHSETYFTLYELENLSVIEQPAYFDLIRNPTPWSLKMRQHFSKVLRIPGVNAATGGQGMGAGAIIQAYSVDRRTAENALDAINAFLGDLITQGCLFGFKVVTAEPNQKYDVFTQEETTDPDSINLVVIAEGESTQSLADVQTQVTEQMTTMLRPFSILRNDLFTLLMSYRGDEFPSNRADFFRIGAPKP